MSSDDHLLGGVRAMVQTLYSAALDDRQALGDAQDKVHTAYNIAQDQFIAGALSNLDCSRRNNPWSQSTPPSLHPMPHSYKTKLRYSKRWEAAGEAKASPFARGDASF